MLSYCLKCRRNTESINPKVSKTTNGKAMILSTCAICGSKKSKFIKQQEAKGLLSNLVISKVSESGAKLIPENEQLANELHKPIIRKLEKRKVYSTFKDNIWGVNLADMQLLSKYNKGIRFLLCVIDIFSKYAWVVPLKDKKGISIVKAFQGILKQSNRKPNKIWVDKVSEFYNAYFKKWLRDNDTVMYSTHNEGKSVVAERFIRTLKSKIYRYMTSI